MDIKKLIVIGCVGAAFCLFAQGTASIVPIGAGSTETAAAATDTVKVQGKGSGITRAEALKDAYRDAVERAVGLYVDAEQMVKNDELVSEQILTQSNAYVEKYDVVKESSANGLVTLRILATVKKTALTKRLSDVMPPQTFKLGDDAQNVHAVAVTQEKRSEDAVALLKKTLDGVNPVTQLVRLSLADPKLMTQEIRDRGGSTKTCYFYRFKFELDEKKYYEEFLPPLLKVLDQISVSQPKTVRLQSKNVTSEEGANYILSGEWVNDTYKNSWAKRRYRTHEPSRQSLDGLYEGMKGHEQEGAYEGVVSLGSVGNYWHLSGGGKLSPLFGNGCRFEIPSCHSSPENMRRRSGRVGDMLDAEAFPVMVITEMNASRTSVQARCYELPKGCAEVILIWQWRLCAADNSRMDRIDPRGRTAYNIVLKDRNNEDVVVRSISFQNVALINAMAGQGTMFKGSARDGGYGWYVTPMIHTDAKSLQRWIGFDIPRDDLPKIASVSIELAE